MTKKLTPEDLHLWQMNTQDVKPLSKTRVPRKKIPIYHSLHSTPPIKKVNPIEKTASSFFPIPSLGRKALRHIRIEARLDMHGLTLESGYLILEKFLLTAQERRIKTVLIITGKGSLNNENTLRRQVPRWIEETPIRHLVRSLHHPAKLQDGGTGAYYVEVRERNKLPPLQHKLARKY